MELERVISEAEQIGSVVVLGDFNAHLGVLGGCRGIGEANQQGVLLEDFLRRCDLNAVSLGYLASGPGYMYVSGTVWTVVVDYILMDVDVISMMSSCCTHSVDVLNTSDHLPLTVTPLYEAISAPLSFDSSSTQIDWDFVWKSEAREEYNRRIQDSLNPLLQHLYMFDDISQINCEIEHVARILVNTAEEVLPLIEPKRMTR